MADFGDIHRHMAVTADEPSVASKNPEVDENQPLLSGEQTSSTFPAKVYVGCVRNLHRTV